MGPRPAISLIVPLIASGLLLGARLASAVEIVPGQTYPGGTELTASDAGVTTRVPDGWQAALPVGAQVLVMARSDEQAYLFVMADEWGQAQALAQMSTPIDLGDGIVFHPRSAPAADRSGLISAEYHVSGTPRPADGAIWTRIGPHGVGVAFLAVDMDGRSGAREAARELASGLRFAAPVQPQQGSGGTAAWQDYMRGRYIARYYSGSNYHEKTELWLCSDGRFAKTGDSGGFGGGASGAFASRGQGRWKASGKQPDAGVLTLEYTDGAETYALSLRDDKLYLDGTQWLRGENERCP